jgi:hypothetical protein
MQLRGNRKTERAAVNATRAFFEANDFVFQEVDAGNDYGKDAYVDLTEGITVTGFMVALQIKGGASYRRPGGYGIPLDSKHEAIWRGSTAPVGGIVQDPEDGLLRWCNISQYLEEHTNESCSYIPVPSTQILAPESLQTAFRDSFRHFWDRRSAGLAVLRLCTGKEDEQMGALLDCFAFGRRDARVLIVLRYMLRMFRGTAMHHVIHILSHITPHPDIMWHKGNWISSEICREVSQHFRWTIDEVLLLFSAVPWEEWQRGGIGESLYMLFHEDPDIKPKMEQAAYIALDSCNEEVAFGALYLTLYWARDKGWEKYCEMLNRDSRFGELILASELMACFESAPFLTLFE